MSLSLNYQKRKNQELFSTFEKELELYNIQNYIPIYDRFFNLSEKNYNDINLNHPTYIHKIRKYNKDDNEFLVLLKTSSNETIKRDIFIKFAPLLDPFKFMTGKYKVDDPTLFNLPNFKNSSNLSKIMDKNNSAYTDSFFYFISSCLLNEHNFIHSIDFYGSFIAMKKNFNINICDDLDYLVECPFFISNKNKLFKVEDYSHLILDESNNYDKPKTKLNINFEDCNETIIQFDTLETSTDNSTSLLTLQELNETSVENDDNNNTLINESEHFDFNMIHCSEDIGDTSSIKSSDCSSRTSHTRDSELNEYSDNECNDNDCNNSQHIHNKNGSRSGSKASSNNTNGSGTNDSYYSEDEEEIINATLTEFPVQLICIEKCKDTFDNLIIEGNIKTEEWFTIFMQIIMTLLTYQKLFSFTHNDLHTNNIMYCNTSIKYLYYCYNNNYYKVPTFGKIFKIIDFGRSIYKVKNNLFCSDSYKFGSDAYSQYNTEPYFNNELKRRDPNPSFDLCRLACSIYDYIVDDDDNEDDMNDDINNDCSDKNNSLLQNYKNKKERDDKRKKLSPVVKLMKEWTTDDKGANILYKTNGVERYPDFKLYKMIARLVHKHTPENQLEKTEFKSFLINKTKIPKGEKIMNIDIMIKSQQ